MRTVNKVMAVVGIVGLVSCLGTVLMTSNTLAAGLYGFMAGINVMFVASAIKDAIASDQ